jgi:hypothetical protein
MTAQRGLGTVPEEVWVFARIAAYAFFIATVYWFVSYEVAGTVLLLGFGMGSLVPTVILLRGARANVADPSADRQAASEPTSPDGPFGDERGRLPMPSAAPLGVGAGVALATLGVAFGIWLVILGIVVATDAGLVWLRAAMREAWATEHED